MSKQVSVSKYVDSCPQRVITAAHYTVETWLPIDLSCGHSARVNQTVQAGDLIGCTDCQKTLNR